MARVGDAPQEPIEVRPEFGEPSTGFEFTLPEDRPAAAEKEGQEDGGVEADYLPNEVTQSLSSYQRSSCTQGGTSVTIRSSGPEDAVLVLKDQTGAGWEGADILWRFGYGDWQMERIGFPNRAGRDEPTDGPSLMEIVLRRRRR